MKILATHYWLVTGGIDMRLGIDGLTCWIQQRLGVSPCEGDAYLFCNQRRNRLKLVCWDGNGVWLCQRRLHRGSFVWGTDQQGRVTITEAQWEWLISGVDWKRAHPRIHAQWKV